LEHPIVAALGQRRIGGRGLDSGVRFDQFLVPPPDVHPGAANDDTVFARHTVAIVSAIQQHREVGLFKIVQALGLDRRGLGAAQGGQKHRGQNRDDGDDDQQLDESGGGSAKVLEGNAVSHGRPGRRKILRHVLELQL